MTAHASGGVAVQPVAERLRLRSEAPPPELTAVDLQAALAHIGAVTGDDGLDAVFPEHRIGQ